MFQRKALWTQNNWPTCLKYTNQKVRLQWEPQTMLFSGCIHFQPYGHNSFDVGCPIENCGFKSYCYLVICKFIKEIPFRPNAQRSKVCFINRLSHHMPFNVLVACSSNLHMLRLRFSMNPSSLKILRTEYASVREKLMFTDCMKPKLVVAVQLMRNSW